MDDLREWIAVRRAAGIPNGRSLFCHMDGTSVTVDQVRDMLVKAFMQAAGRDPQVCKEPIHSLTDRGGDGGTRGRGAASFDSTHGALVVRNLRDLLPAVTGVGHRRSCGDSVSYGDAFVAVL